jgi:hypothetical protein
MAKRFITRLFHTIMPDGSMVVCWADEIPAGATRGILFEHTGPRALTPPGAMTQQEYALWQWSLQEEGFRTGTKAAMPLTRVEEFETLDEEDYERMAVRVAVEAVPVEDSDAKTLHARVENCGEVPIPQLEVWWSCDYESPQPVEGLKVKATCVGGSLSFARESGADDELAPWNSCDYQLDPRAIPSLKSQVAALSPERYRIRITSGGHEIERLDGDDISAALEALDE